MNLVQENIAKKIHIYFTDIWYFTRDTSYLINTLQTIYNYFKEKITTTEAEAFMKIIEFIKKQQKGKDANEYYIRNIMFHITPHIYNITTPELLEAILYSIDMNQEILFYS